MQRDPRPGKPLWPQTGPSYLPGGPSWASLLRRPASVPLGRQLSGPTQARRVVRLAGVPGAGQRGGRPRPRAPGPRPPPRPRPALEAVLGRAAAAAAAGGASGRLPRPAASGPGLAPPSGVLDSHRCARRSPQQSRLPRPRGPRPIRPRAAPDVTGLCQRHAGRKAS